MINHNSVEDIEVNDEDDLKARMLVLNTALTSMIISLKVDVVL